jgi:squalene cyclase
MKTTRSGLDFLIKAVFGLTHFLHDGLHEQVETTRTARVAYALICCGCSVKVSFFIKDVANYILSTQKSDGGWADVEETLWSLGYLAAFGEKYDTEITNGQDWLASVKLPCGAWGKSSRDQPRIPITALAATLAPETIGKAGLSWLAKQWEADLNTPTQLTYKGAFFLLAQAHSWAYYKDNLVDRTVAYLISEQEEDGGFSPWKGHPAGSDPWSTGVALWGLSKVRCLVSRRTIERALSWLQSKQLSNGLWPYHYLDDGTAMALIGVSSVLPILREH